ncbi:hypothetical protein [Listeria immobilis]|uniref:hypothetical protein n=1 Tax=Listeria immobilis TaxID=2713502 RepID=UPI00164D64E7|nr:hypothetical protein [Listeria immobilis]MBC6312015.1 hypothetical protein [Listeria immobilis]
MNIIILFITTFLSFCAGLGLNIFKERQTLKMKATRLKHEELYLPLSLFLDELFYKYGAYNFNDLTSNEQTEIINFLRHNAQYMNSKIMTAYYEFRSSLAHQKNEDDIELTNKIFEILSGRIFTYFLKLQRKLGLPKPVINPNYSSLDKIENSTNNPAN